MEVPVGTHKKTCVYIYVCVVRIAGKGMLRKILGDNW